MSTPKVSVVIPNYNHGRYLRQRIESVLNQTYKNFEVIILDDCSSDNSREIINEYRQSPLVKHVVYNQQNSGNPFHQWKQGLEKASGEWIWFAESDDYCDLNFLETMFSSFPDDHQFGLLYCDSYIVTGDGIVTDSFAALKNKKFDTNRWSENYINNGLDEIEEYILPGGTINNSSAVLFNRKTLSEANPFDVNLRYIGDKYAFVKVLARSDVGYVKESMNYYRDPFSNKHADRYVFYFFEQFQVFDWILKNTNPKNLEKFWEGFYENTSNSLFRDWSASKISIYRRLFAANPGLLFKSIKHNLARSIRSFFRT